MKSKKKEIPSKIKKGDLVIVIAGREKGRQGKVIEMLRSENRAVIENLNLVKRHIRPSKDDVKGGIVEKPASIHLSNIMILDPKENRPTRIGMKLVASDGSDNSRPRYVRFSKVSGEILD